MTAQSQRIDIPIWTRGQIVGHAIVDREDANQAAHKWRLDKDGYVVRGRAARIRLHREILGVPQGTEVDHRDQDKLNNVRSNLRPATREQNSQNLPAITIIQSRRVTSLYRGVDWFEHLGMWRARVRVNKRIVFCQYFALESDADEAVREARARLMPFSREAAA